MNIPKLILASVLIVISLNSCFNKNTTSINNIEGIWISAKDISSQFGDADNIALFIKKESNGSLSVRGCFIRNDEFKMEWKFINVQYDSFAKSISMLDSDLDTLICSLDFENEMLVGAVHSEDETNSINFVRTEKDLTNLFYPQKPDNNGHITYSYKMPEQIDNNLKTDTIFRFAKDSTSVYKLMEKIINEKFGRLESILIIKDGKLILEEYFFGYNRTKLHRINSCTKSVTSLLLGMTLNRNKMDNVEQSIFNFFPQFNSYKTPENEKIKLKHVLTMTAGFNEDGDFEDNGPDNLIRYILDSEMDTKPGEKFRYSGKCTNLLGGIIYTLEKKQADEFAKEVLLNKLGISEFDWKKENGVLPCDAGLQLYPRDMAKIGLLVLNNGKWNGEQIVPEEWIVASTKAYVAESEFFDYGYQWWYRSNRNKSWWNNPVHGSKNEHDMFLALGAGGQYIMVIRDLNMVIITTASDYNRDGMDHIKVPMVIEEVVPIFEDALL
ncbi:MAG: beta-lactamase family protein [Melioribacteraceae bacterium]|nr:beta-lactamase family protein [Melioribacteraceae bacterium]MCF8355957.1 beta-lactamase family protein [Melioribacteraceae bacterium]MCF8420790.1 beta-lactamase family protein [Melioribacteraceae bacterium]